MITFQVKVINDVGLHARPAAIFVRMAKSFESTIKIRNVTKNGNTSDAKSILGVLVLGVEKNHEIELEISGADEVLAAEKLKRLIESDFQLDNELTA